MTLVGDVGVTMFLGCRSVGLRIPCRGSLVVGAKVTWVRGVNSDWKDIPNEDTLTVGWLTCWLLFLSGSFSDSSSTSSISVNGTTVVVQGIITSSVSWVDKELLRSTSWRSLSSWLYWGGWFNPRFSWWEEGIWGCILFLLLFLPPEEEAREEGSWTRHTRFAINNSRA